MNQTLRELTARVAIAALVLCFVPWSVVAAGPMARLEGLVIDETGQRSSGTTVYLFDREGATRAEGTADEDGVYSIGGLPAGEYGIGVVTAAGDVAPVAAPPIRLDGGELARRDLKLVEADAAAIDQAMTANYGFGSWFGSLSGGEKAGVLVGFVALAFLIYEALDEEDADEETSSVVDPASF